MREAQELLASVEGRLKQLQEAREGAAQSTAAQQEELVAARQQLQAKQQALTQQEGQNRKSRRATTAGPLRFRVDGTIHET